MNKFKALLLISFTVLLSSCDSEVEPALIGELGYDDSIYPVTTSINNWKIKGEGMSVFVLHFSDGLWEDGKNGLNPSDNTSTLLSITLKSPDNTEIVSGLYKYGEWLERPWEGGTIFFGAFLDEFDKNKETKFDEGIIEVRGKYPKLEFYFDLIDKNGKSLTGYIAGDIGIEYISD